tara:strand:+ start:1980 stop:2132 length:153 start_codon:yes stop_codon:yes gene_type:complete
MTELREKIIDLAGIVKNTDGWERLKARIQKNDRKIDWRGLFRVAARLGFM